jgi:hypothetical protein
VTVEVSQADSVQRQQGVKEPICGDGVECVWDEAAGTLGKVGWAADDPWKIAPLPISRLEKTFKIHPSLPSS